MGRGGEELFLVLGGVSEVVLYGWRGVFTPIQTLPASGVTGFTAFTTGGDDMVVVANGGTSGNREITSHVYRLTASQELTMVRADQL